MHSLSVLLLIVESYLKFSINFFIFLNLITLLNWVLAYSHIRYLTSPPLFLHCLMISVQVVI